MGVKLMGDGQWRIYEWGYSSNQNLVGTYNFKKKRYVEYPSGNTTKFSSKEEVLTIPAKCTASKITVTFQGKENSDKIQVKKNGSTVNFVGTQKHVKSKFWDYTCTTRKIIRSHIGQSVTIIKRRAGGNYQLTINFRHKRRRLADTPLARLETACLQAAEKAMTESG